MDVHELYMHRCLQLAAMGSGYVAPNPMVGAVLVHRGRIIGEGWHQNYGEAHAEVNCLNSVLEADRHLIPESTLYVSLEPCAHFGKTPPCANRIVQEGIRAVVIGTRDPFEQVNGRGIDLLEKSGVQVVTGVLEKECRFQNRRFFTFHEKRRPYIQLKWAQTMDGFMGSGTTHRLKITGAFADRLVHKLRSTEAAIMVGTATAMHDNPQLNNRLWSGAQPLRIVIDRELKLPAGSFLLNDGGKTLVLNEKKEERKGNLHFRRVEGLAGRNAAGILQALYELNVQSVLIEGGALLLKSFLDSGLWDEAHLLTNTGMVAGTGLRAPEKPAGKIMDTAFLQQDRIEWILK